MHYLSYIVLIISSLLFPNQQEIFPAKNSRQVNIVSYKVSYFILDEKCVWLVYSSFVRRTKQMCTRIIRLRQIDRQDKSETSRTDELSKRLLCGLHATKFEQNDYKAKSCERKFVFIRIIRLLFVVFLVRLWILRLTVNIFAFSSRLNFKMISFRTQG